MALFKRQPSDEEIRAEQERRRRIGTAYHRFLSAIGIVGIGAAIGAIMGSQDVSGWVIGLVVALASVLLAAILWTYRI